MSAHTRWYRRRSLYGVLVVAVAAAAIPISYAFAGTGNRVTLPMQRYDGSCDYFSKDKVVGSATFERTKSNSLKVSVTLHGVNPSTSYYIGLESDSPSACTFLDYHAKIKIDASGNGSASFEVAGLGGYGDFWIYAANSGSTEHERTPIAHV